MTPHYADDNSTIYVGDCRAVLRGLPAESVHCVVTSPPYWGLRTYGVDGQLGLEPTPEEYLETMVAVFREVRRVMRKDATLWLNMGDGWAGGGRGGNPADSPHRKQATNAGSLIDPMPVPRGLKPKDLLGMPWRLALALQADGWWLRSDIIWAKGVSFSDGVLNYVGNPMPESCTDRPTKSHEHVFLMARSARYFYDAEAVREAGNTPWHSVGGYREGNIDNDHRPEEYYRAERERGGRNLRDVWTIPTHPYRGSHFATFPPKLIQPCIKAGTSLRGCCAECGAPWRRVMERSGQMPCDENAGADLEALRATNNDADRRRQMSGAKHAAWKASNPDVFRGWEPGCKCEATVVPCTVLDPFLGSGTTLQVAREQHCRGIGIELNPAYADMAVRRLRQGHFEFGEKTCMGLLAEKSQEPSDGDTGGPDENRQ